MCGRKGKSRLLSVPCGISTVVGDSATPKWYHHHPVSCPSRAIGQSGGGWFHFILMGLWDCVAYGAFTAKGREIFT